MYNVPIEIRRTSGGSDVGEGALIAKAKAKLFSQTDSDGFASQGIGSTSVQISVQMRYDLIQLEIAKNLDNFLEEFQAMSTRIIIDGKGYIVSSITIINPMVRYTRPNKLKFKVLLQ